MRKFIFFLLLFPAVLALGHDIYIFTQEQDKGFRLSDVGALWDKYHKESHDQWKVKLQEIEGTAKELSPFPDQQQPPVAQTGASENVTTLKTGYNESFTQTNENGETTAVTPLQQGTVKTQASGLQKVIGFLLEQTAVFVFAGFAALAYVLNAFCCCVCSKKSNLDNMGRPKKKKGEGYKYKRK